MVAFAAFVLLSLTAISALCAAVGYNAAANVVRTYQAEGVIVRSEEGPDMGVEEFVVKMGAR